MCRALERVRAQPGFYGGEAALGSTDDDLVRFPIHQEKPPPDSRV